MTAHTPTISTSTSAVGPGHAKATIPAARSTRPSGGVFVNRPGVAAAERPRGLHAGGAI